MTAKEASAMTQTQRAADGTKIGNRARKACDWCGKRYPHSHPQPASQRRPAFVEATDRDEDEPCEAGTVGCCVDHRCTTADVACQPW